MFRNRELDAPSYGKALEAYILRLIDEAVDGRLLESELYEVLGRHQKIVDKITELMYKNVIRRIPIEVGNTKDYLLFRSRSLASLWSTMKAMPCFTCEHISICKIGNDRSSLNCESFNNWILDKFED